MSSSRQNGLLLPSKKSSANKGIGLVCPTCGRGKLAKIIGDHRMGDGFLVRNIERLNCTVCGENLFSPEAMKEMEKQRLTKNGK